MNARRAQASRSTAPGAVRFLPMGRDAVLVEVADHVEVARVHAALANAQIHAQNHAQDHDRAFAGVELVPAARTVLVAWPPGCGPADPTGAVRDAVAVTVGAAAAPAFPDGGGVRDDLVLPTRYDGPDTAEVAAGLGCSVAALVDRHTRIRWRVAFVGFAPGFGYLVAPEGEGFSVPRRASPRARVPAGSVALAGEYTGVYPRSSPGGWQLVGSTDVALFDLAQTPPAALTPGRHVRFEAVR